MTADMIGWAATENNAADGSAAYPDQRTMSSNASVGPRHGSSCLPSHQGSRCAPTAHRPPAKSSIHCNVCRLPIIEPQISSLQLASPERDKWVAHALMEV